MPDSPSRQLILDPNNANAGTPRGEGMVEHSLRQYGAGRSVLSSADGVILAGNKTYARAVELGIPVKEIESDGHTLFVIKRTDLPYDDPRAKELAIADNRSSEVGLSWDAEVLASFAEDGIDLGQFWFEDELAALLTDRSDGFLDDALASGDGSSPWPEPESDGSDPNTMTLRVTPEERDIIMAAVRLARKVRGAESTPLALVTICEEWRCQHAS